LIVITAKLAIFIYSKKVKKMKIQITVQTGDQSFIFGPLTHPALDQYPPHILKALLSIPPKADLPRNSFLVSEDRRRRQMLSSVQLYLKEQQ